MFVTTVRRLIDTMHTVKANPGATVKTGIWSDSAWTAAELRRWFHECLDTKINRNLPRGGRQITTTHHNPTTVVILRRQPCDIGDIGGMPDESPGEIISRSGGASKGGDEREQ